MMTYGMEIECGGLRTEGELYRVIAGIQGIEYGGHYSAITAQELLDFDAKRTEMATYGFRKTTAHLTVMRQLAQTVEDMKSSRRLCEALKD